MGGIKGGTIMSGIKMKQPSGGSVTIIADDTAVDKVINIDSTIESSNINSIVRLTQAEYDVLTPPEPSTMYVIVG